MWERRKEEVERQTLTLSKQFGSGQQKKETSKGGWNRSSCIHQFIYPINIGHFVGARHHFTHWSHIREGGNALSFGIVPKISDDNRYSELEEGHMVDRGWTGTGARLVSSCRRWDLNGRTQPAMQKNKLGEEHSWQKKQLVQRSWGRGDSRKIGFPEVHLCKVALWGEDRAEEVSWCL